MKIWVYIGAANDGGPIFLARKWEGFRDEKYPRIQMEVAAVKRYLRAEKVWKKIQREMFRLYKDTPH